MNFAALSQEVYDMYNTVALPTNAPDRVGSVVKTVTNTAHFESICVLVILPNFLPLLHE